MKKKFFIQLYILKLFANEILSKYAYFDFKLTCLDDYVKYINSSESSFYPETPYIMCLTLNLNYIYNLEKIIQDLDKQICFYIVNCQGYFFIFI